MPLVNRIVTVTDDEGKGHNVLAPIGTPVTDLLGNMENVTIAQRLVVWGNCLTGVAFRDTINTPIIKTTGAITVIRKIRSTRDALHSLRVMPRCLPSGLVSLDYCALDFYWKYS